MDDAPGFAGRPPIDVGRIASVDQVALARRDDALDVRVLGGLDVRIHPRRGFDIGAAWYRGLPIGWIAPAGEGGVAGTDWRRSWGGGLLTTCGLDNVGAPSEGVGLHGTFTFLQATDVWTSSSVAGVRCAASIVDPRGLRVRRTVTTAAGSGRLHVRDRTVNESDAVLEAPVLYHVNVGWPLWDEGATVSTDAGSVVPRDEEAAVHAHAIAPAPTRAPERVWEHRGASFAVVENPRLGLRLCVTATLPRLWQWVDPNPRYYALGLEPANCTILGRAHDRAAGALPVLRPGATRETSLTITVGEIDDAGPRRSVPGGARDARREKGSR